MPNRRGMPAADSALEELTGRRIRQRQQLSLAKGSQLDCSPADKRAPVLVVGRGVAD